MHDEEAPPFVIELMTEKDLPAVVALEQVCFSDPWSPAAFRQELKHAGTGGYARVLLEDGEIRAYMIAWFVADEAHLANIAVAPGHRRKGYARALLDDLLAESRQRGSAMVWLEVRVSNAGAIRLYEEYRFRPVAIRKNYYTREREDAVVMLRALGEEEKRAVVQ